MSDDVHHRTMITIQIAPSLVRSLAYLVQNFLIILIIILRKLLNKICEKSLMNFDVFSWNKRIMLKCALIFELLVFTLANSLLWDRLITFSSRWIIAGIITIILDRIPYHYSVGFVVYI